MKSIDQNKNNAHPKSTQMRSESTVKSAFKTDNQASQIDLDAILKQHGLQNKTAPGQINKKNKQPAQAASAKKLPTEVEDQQRQTDEKPSDTSDSLAQPKKPQMTPAPSPEPSPEPTGAVIEPNEPKKPTPVLSDRKSSDAETESFRSYEPNPNDDDGSKPKWLYLLGGVGGLGLLGIAAAAAGGGGSDDEDIPSDTVAPTLIMSSNKQSVATGETATIVFDFSESVQGFSLSDITSSFGTLSQLQGQGKQYTAVFKPFDNASGQESVTVLANSVMDSGGNTNTLTASGTLFTVVDNLAPTVSFGVGKTKIVGNQPTTLTFTFSEAVSDFTLADLTAKYGTFSNLQVSGTKYTVLYTPDGSLGVTDTIAIAAGTFQDGYGHLNTKAASVQLELTTATTTQAPLEFISEANKTNMVKQFSTANSTNWKLAGDDASQFTMNASTGALSFTSAAQALVDVESPGDKNKDGLYLLQLQGFDQSGQLVETHHLSYQLQDVTELPTDITSTSTFGSSNAAIKSLLDNDLDQSSWHYFNDPTFYGDAVNLTYSFAPLGASATFGDENSILSTQKIDGEFSEVAKTKIRSIFNSIAEVSKITFTEKTDFNSNSAQIRLFSGSSDLLKVGTGTLGFAYQPDGTSEGKGNYQGDVFFVNDAKTIYSGAQDPFSSNYSSEAQTILHEVLHAVGLDHPFNDDTQGAGFSPYGATGDTYENRLGKETGGGYDNVNTDNLLETAMAYNDAYRGPDTDFLASGILVSAYSPVNPGIYDTAALQHLYGANLKTRTGNDTYTFDSASPSFLTIWDGGGQDTIVHKGSNQAIIDLNAGHVSKVGAVPGWIAHSLGFSDEIESVVLDKPQAGKVTIDADLFGYVFETSFEPGGFDGSVDATITYKSGDTYTETFDEFSDALVPNADTLSNVAIALGVTIENAQGDAGNDILIGNQAANRLLGRQGNDTLTGGSAGDTFVFDGLFGQDTITDFTRGQDRLEFSSAFANSVIGFSNGVMTVANFGTIALTGVTQMVQGEDYFIL